jgi:hypothetical protein
VVAHLIANEMLQAQVDCRSDSWQFSMYETYRRLMHDMANAEHPEAMMRRMRATFPDLANRFLGRLAKYESSASL